MKKFVYEFNGDTMTVLALNKEAADVKLKYYVASPSLWKIKTEEKKLVAQTEEA